MRYQGSISNRTVVCPSGHKKFVFNTDRPLVLILRYDPQDLLCNNSVFVRLHCVVQSSARGTGIKGEFIPLECPSHSAECRAMLSGYTYRSMKKSNTLNISFNQDVPYP